MPIRVTTAGHITVQVDGVALPLTSLGRAGRVMLAYLVCERHRPVSRDELAEALWGEDLPRSSEQMVRGLVSKVRLTLSRAGLDPMQALITTFGAYQLKLPDDAVVDIEEAAVRRDEAMARLTAGDPGTAYQLATGVVRIAAQQFFPGATEAWIERRQAELRELHLSALDVVASAATAVGRITDAVAAAERAISLEPFRESAYLALMKAHAAGGSRGEALRAYERCREVLVEELGISPSPLVEAAYLDLLRDDALPATAAPAEAPDVAVLPLPAALAATSRSVLVGRDAELGRLTDALAAASIAGRQAVLVSGEAGIGKTALVGAAAREAHAAGAWVLYGRCDEDLDLPYQPFAEALSHLVTLAPLPELEAHVAANGGDLSRLTPDLARRIPEAAPPPPTDPEADRYRLFEAVARVLSRVAVSTPLVLVLDDIHWATQGTVHMLRHVLRTVMSDPLLVVATFRQTEVNDTLASALADFRRDGLVGERLQLEGLDVDGVAAYMTATTRSAGGPDRTEAQAVQAHTAGNPFFVGELLRHLDESGARLRKAGPWTYYDDVDNLGVPDGVAEVVARRLRRLSDRANRIVAWSSAIGSVFDLDLLERAAKDEDAFEALEEAVASHLVVEVRPGHYRFSHAIVRDTVYASLTATRRARLHRTVGEALEADAQPASASRSAALAYHFAAAAPIGGALKAADHAMDAARYAFADAAWEEAAALIERGLAALELHATADPERTCELLILLAETWLRYFDPVKVRSASARAVEAARAVGRPELLARAAYWRLRIGPDGVSELSELAALTQEALAGLGPSDLPLRAKILAVSYEGIAPGAHLTTRREAVELARRSGDLDALGVALWRLADSLRGSPAAEEFLALAEELVERAPPHGWDGWRNRHLFTAWGRLTLADRDGFEASRRACEQFGAERGFWYYRYMPALQAATLALLDGRFDEVDYLAIRAADIARQAALSAAGFEHNLLLRQRFRLAYERGESTAALQAAAELAERAHWAGPNTIEEGILAMARVMADPDTHRRALEAFADRDVPSFPPERVGVTLAYQVEVATAIGLAGRAHCLYEALLPYRNQVVIGGMGEGCQGAVDRFLGILATELGDLDGAEHHFEVALALEESLRSPPLIARTSYWYARMQLRRKEPGDARHLLVTSLRAAEELGMKGLAREAMALLGEA